MPLPFILAGAAIAAGSYGVKKGVDAKSDIDRAKRINRNSRIIFDEAKDDLESARNDAQEAMNHLGEFKFRVYEQSIIPFVDIFKQIKNIDFSESDLNDGEFNTSEKELDGIAKSALAMKEIVSGGISSLGAGGLAGIAVYGGVGVLGTASTGTAIGALSGAAATNATLAWLGGGSLAAGGFGMAGGMVVLGGIVAGPVLAVGGMMLASKAEAAKEDARANLHKAEVAAEEMKTALVTTNAIENRFFEISSVLEQLNTRFEPLLAAFKELVSKNNNYTTYNSDEKHSVHLCLSVALTLKNLLETPLLSDSGFVSKKSADILESGNKCIEATDSGEVFKFMDVEVEVEEKPEVPRRKENLYDLMNSYNSLLNDGRYVYCGVKTLIEKKIDKKIKNAHLSYAHYDWDNDSDSKKYSGIPGPIVFIDTTLFGSGKDGFYITEDEIVAKPFLGKRFYIKLDDIIRISLDKDERNLIVNGEELSYVHSELNRSMETIVDVLNKYIDQ